MLKDYIKSTGFKEQVSFLAITAIVLYTYGTGLVSELVYYIVGVLI